MLPPPDTCSLLESPFQSVPMLPFSPQPRKQVVSKVISYKKNCLLSLSSRGDHNKKVIRTVSLLMFVSKSYQFQKTEVTFFTCDNWMAGIHIIEDYCVDM